MLYSQYRWNTPNIDLEAAAGLSQALSVSPLVGRLLVSRGVHNEKEAERFCILTLIRCMIPICSSV